MTVVGARPQFVKAAVVSRAIKNVASQGIVEHIVHTGQHFDENMSGVFFDQLQIPRPTSNLGVGGKSHGHSTGEMIAALEDLMVEVRPDVVIVYGDTNSTLAAAIAAAKLHIDIAHVEAGLRSFNKRMPEEINRVLTDHVSRYLFCPTSTAVENLDREGVSDGVHNVGDVMFDASKFYAEVAEKESKVLEHCMLRKGDYVLATCHRQENTDDPERLREILVGLSQLAEVGSVVLPIHPRTKLKIDEFGLSCHLGNVQVVEPLSYLDMLVLEKYSRTIVTDSGGVQKEAYFFNVPCITIRDETEWVETVQTGHNILAGADAKNIKAAFNVQNMSNEWPNLFGTGDAGDRIVSMLLSR